MGIDSNKIQIEEKKGYEPSGVTEQLENKGLVMGDSGSLGIIGGSVLNAAKGAINVIKSVIKGKNVSKAATKVVKDSKQFGGPAGQYSGTTGFYSKDITRRTNAVTDFGGAGFKSKAPKIGAGGNSYSKGTRGGFSR
jgi:hypothetical protein